MTSDPQKPYSTPERSPNPQEGTPLVQGLKPGSGQSRPVGKNWLLGSQHSTIRRASSPYCLDLGPRALCQAEAMSQEGISLNVRRAVTTQPRYSFPRKQTQIQPGQWCFRGRPSQAEQHGPGKPGADMDYKLQASI